MSKQSGLSKLKDPKYLACFLIAFCALASAGISIPGKLAFSPTDSVGYRVFFISGGTADHLKNDDFVIFPLYTETAPGCRPCTVVKKIACMEGESLTVNHRNFFCNGKYIGTAKTHSKDGDPVTTFIYNGVIPANKLFVMGACRDSYDSRYFGFIDKKDVTARVVPVM
jgi:conjugal transfer pilin signal peptidase TrbI